MCGCVDASPWPELQWQHRLQCGFSEPHLAEVGAEHLAEPALEPCREDSPEITSPVVPFTSLCLAKRVAYRNQ